MKTKINRAFKPTVLTDKTQRFKAAHSYKKIKINNNNKNEKKKDFFN